MAPPAAARPDADPTAVPVHLMRGEDPSLLRDAVHDLVHRLVGDGDRSLMVEELAGDDYELAALVDAAQTPPFLTERRVVVGRDAHRFSSADAVAPLVAYLGDPLPSTSLVLVWESGRVPKSLIDAVKAAGGAHVDTAPGRNVSAWLDQQVAEAGIRLDAAGRALLVNHLGEDVGRVRGILATLVSAHGPGARLGEEDVAPFLGDAGALAPWDLTDAIDSGNIELALDRLHRMLGAGERHALQVMASLHRHYAQMLRLDGSDVTDERQAAEVLGLRGRSTYPAKKALDQLRRLGHARVAQAIALLAQADVDFRGLKDWPPELVLEVLVARLANLSRR